MAGTILQPGVRVGKNTIINIRSSIDHDSKIGDQVHGALGVTICGEVSIGSGTFNGAGAVIINRVTVGENASIAAGAVVVADVATGAHVRGVSAKSSG